MNLILERERIIERLQHITDVDLIKAVQLLLDSDIENKQQVNDIAVPEWHKNIVRKRIEQSKKNPETLLSWDDVMNELDS